MSYQIFCGDYTQAIQSIGRANATVQAIKTTFGNEPFTGRQFDDAYSHDEQSFKRMMSLKTLRKYGIIQVDRVEEFPMTKKSDKPITTYHNKTNSIRLTEQEHRKMGYNIIRQLEESTNNGEPFQKETTDTITFMAKRFYYTLDERQFNTMVRNTRHWADDKISENIAKLEHKLMTLRSAQEAINNIK